MLCQLKTLPEEKYLKQLYKSDIKYFWWNINYKQILKLTMLLPCQVGKKSSILIEITLLPLLPCQGPAYPEASLFCHPSFLSLPSFSLYLTGIRVCMQLAVLRFSCMVYLVYLLILMNRLLIWSSGPLEH